MNCPNCHASAAGTDRFCRFCGMPLYLQNPQPVQKKGSLRVPALILLVMSIAGIILFFATSQSHVLAPVRSSSGCFSIQGGVLYFDESRYTGSEELTVPREVAGETVTALSDSCFSGCTGLTTVYLPDTLISIGESAFSGCTSMRGIVIPDNVTTIGENAFYGCTQLEAIRIPDSVRSIGDNAFDHCSYLTYIFFEGTCDQWTSLYDEFINLYTGVFCVDGEFYQNGDVYG